MIRKLVMPWDSDSPIKINDIVDKVNEIIEERK